MRKANREKKIKVRIGVDTGGTFTDFVISIDGKIFIKKILSTPQNPSLSILEGVKEFLESSSIPKIIHGTTVGTNALLERKGGRIAFVTTKGFEDILFIGRQTRRKLYSLKGEERSMLLPRHLCFGLEERTSVSGKVENKLELSELKKIIEKMKFLKVEAVAISLINSYANSTNEDLIFREFEKENIMASVSSKILPEHREYERSSTTAVNAYLMPVISRYLALLEEKIGKADLEIMQSNEGYISPSKARIAPIRTALSGPAGGAVGAFHLAKAAGFKNIISFDMGGTSTDVSLIEGKIRRTNESVIGDFPIRVPIIDIHSVGAGGGSIAYVDKGGSLRVGPQSAGANPGPACYGKGNFPTVTDANLFLGRLDHEFFLGGKMKIFPERSPEVLEKLAKKINKSPLETAFGVIEIANANMEKAIRVISIERGFDQRNFALFSFGGAGGMHAAEIASHLQIKTVIVPKNAGVLSALGLLLADSIKDYSKSILKTVDRIKPRELEDHFAELIRESLKEMKEDGFKENEISIERYLDLRYLGQSYEITIPFQSKKASPFSFLPYFHKEHRRLYSYHHPQRLVEIVNIRVKAVGQTKKIKLKKLQERGKTREIALLKKQAIYFGGKKYQGSVYDRSLLEPGNRICGPALIVDFESTTFLPPHYLLKVDGFLNLIIQKG